MFKLIINIFKNQSGGLGITQASITSAVADRTGDDSADAIVKINRVINEVGPDFCMLTNWPFLRENLSFSLTTSAYTYSGASYLPTAFKRIVAAYLTDSNSNRYDLDEVSIGEAHRWHNPNGNSGRPDEFAITRVESGYWEMQFNRLPDEAYTVYLEYEKQWTNLTATTSETVITKDYYNAFVHFCCMTRALQQGDSELFVLLDKQWFDARHPKSCIWGRIMSSLSAPLRKKSVVLDSKVASPYGKSTNDYGTIRSDD